MYNPRLATSSCLFHRFDHLWNKALFANWLVKVASRISSPLSYSLFRFLRSKAVCSEQPEEERSDETGDSDGCSRVPRSNTERLSCDIFRILLRATLCIEGILSRVDNKENSEFKKSSPKKSRPSPTLHVILQHEYDRYVIYTQVGKYTSDRWMIRCTVYYIYNAIT